MTRNARKAAALVLAAWLSAGCAASSPEQPLSQPSAATPATEAAALPHEEATATTGTPTEKKASADAGASMGKRKPPPPLPVIFEVPLDANPHQLEHRLIELGYQRQDWALEAPYSRLTFALADDAATFRRVDMLVCNHPLRIAGLRIQGSDPDYFYEAVKQRFNLGVAEWEKDDKADFRHGRYVREFAGHTRAVLRSERHGAELALEARDVMAECKAALAKDVQDLRAAEQADIDAARARQRDSF